MKAHAGILESDPGEVADTKLAAILEAVPDAGERGWVDRHLRPLVGLGRADASGDVRGEAFAAWRRFLEAVAERGPMVLVFEDLHWADDGLLDFVDGLVDWVDGVPLLVVCTARPELLERRPGWGGGKRNATTVSLAALEDDATARLVLSLLDRPVLDAEMQQALVSRAGGNPLYAEEFVRMLQAGRGVDERLPEIVQGIIAARIDLLPAAEKDLLQTAAVLGKVFWSDALSSAVGAEPWQLTEMLRSLERKAESMEMFEQALALVGHRGRVAGRAYTNLGVAWNAFGDQNRACEVWLDGIQHASRDGDELSASFMRGNMMGILFELGDWDAALERAEAILDGSGAGGYQVGVAHGIRAGIREARGAAAEALDDLDAGILRGRAIGEPQAVWPALILRAGFARRRGRPDEARPMLDEVVAAIRETESVGDLQEWHVELMLELRESGRADEGREILARMPEGRWRDACRGTLEGLLGEAADILASVGSARLAADLRLLAGTSLAAAGKLPEATAQIDLARAFYRKVGATAYLAEADTIVAAAG